MGYPLLKHTVNICDRSYNVCPIVEREILRQHLQDARGCKNLRAAPNRGKILVPFAGIPYIKRFPTESVGSVPWVNTCATLGEIIQLTVTHVHLGEVHTAPFVPI